MIAVTVVSWFAVVAVLTTYASGHRHAYDWANVVLCVPVCLPALLLGAYSSAAISLAFGIIGLARILHRRCNSYT
jgi:hypothetical protein